MSMAPTQPAVATRDSLAITEALINARIRASIAALHDPDWAQYADLIDVEHVDGEFHYILTGDPDRVESALDLEYGANGRQPKPFLGRLTLDG